MDNILEPLTVYKQIYSEKFRHNAEELFDNLVSKSGVDVETNRETVKKYESQKKLLQQTEKVIHNLKVKRRFFILLIVIGVILLSIGIVGVVRESYWIGGFALGIGATLAVAGIILLTSIKLFQRIREAEAIKNQQSVAADNLLKEALKQVKCLNESFDDGMTRQIIQKTLPLIKIDDNFNIKRYDYLNGKYGFKAENNSDKSTIDILSGEIFGNPFVIDRELKCDIGLETYTGSLYITWVETHRDDEGNLQEEYHSQTLYASINRPKPYYTTSTRLIYGNDAAPDLHFSRRASHAERLSERALAHKVKSGMKKIRAKQEKDNNFTEMGNEEFDVLFGAVDRDNEVQFRLLFTPLAQKNLLMLMKDSEGYGDDFDMIKSGCLNYILSDHMENWNPDISPNAYCSYSVDITKNKFISLNAEYFRCLYFSLAPLLSIPLYQQIKPKEYIYKEDYPNNFTSYEREYAVNNIGQSAFEPYDAATQSILKTSLIGKRGKSDKISVTAYSFREEPRTEYVTVLGDDGDFHDVPVDWIEYIPISHTETVMMKELNISKKQFENSAEIANALKKRNISTYGYEHGILCCLTDDDLGFDRDFETDKIKT